MLRYLGLYGVADASYVSVDGGKSISGLVFFMAGGPEGPIPILNDNRGALVWVENSAVQKQKRHVRVRYHYVRQEVEQGHIKFNHVATGDCAADGLTKPLEKLEHRRFVELIGMSCETAP